MINRGKYIGDKQFYKMVLAVAVPIMLQNGITNFVSLLDNIMVGQIGTEQMSGVAIVNQLLFVYNMCLFGATAGAGIFGAQFYGGANYKGMRDTFRFKLIVCGILSVLGLLIFYFFGPSLITLYLHEGSTAGSIADALRYGEEYLWIMMIGLVPFAVVQCYSSTLREQGETVMPMLAGLVAVGVNMCLNSVLIFGLLGAPRLGVQGAAIATVIARFTECGIIIWWTHRHKERNQFIAGAYRSLKIPAGLAKQIFIKGMPLLVNEALWAGGTAMLTQCYSVRGLAVVAGFNISNTIVNVFNVVFIALGSSISIIIGQLLGAGKMKEARETDTKMIFFSVASCLLIGVALIGLAPLFPKIYNTTEEVRGLATSFIIVAACYMPLNAFINAAYFTLRSGGKSIVTFLFDSVYLWAVNIPLAFCLSRFTGIHIAAVYLICQFIDIIKCTIGFILVKKGVWLNNIVSEKEIGF